MNQIVYSGKEKKSGKIYVILGAIIFVVAIVFIGFGIYGLVTNNVNDNANLNEIAKGSTANQITNTSYNEIENTVSNTISENELENTLENTVENTTTNTISEEIITDTQKPSITSVQQSGSKVNVSISDDAALGFLVYKINSSEEKRVSLDGTSKTAEISLQSGSNMLSIVVSDKARKFNYVCICLSSRLSGKNVEA